ncbi:MAG TPA: winged helix-turn-helix transcriptional regulator [Acholeplasmataceae bacterium]|nr:winged helix-turn-helix transcriptional regulator [Acholeplasmataceae bacterium]
MENKQIGKNLFILSSKLRRLLDKKHSKNGLYAGQARILRYLYKNKSEVTYQKDLENAFQIRGGTVTGMLDSLVKNNLIERVESNKDKRKRVILLTKAGEELALKGIETTNIMEDNLSSLLTNKEQLIFDEILNKINNWIDEEENNEKVI